MKIDIAQRQFSLPSFDIPRAVLALWLLHIVISLAFGFYLQANPELPEAPQFSTPDWAGNLAHWDVNWELSITDQGYAPDFYPQTSAKFPLASLFARILHQLFSFPVQVALFVVNKIGVLAGLWALWRLIAHLYDPSTANRAVCYISFPLFGTSFIYWMSYPDPLFLAWWALAFEALFTGRPYRAGLWATLGVWTRPQGALLMPVFALSILIESLKIYGFRPTLLKPAFWSNILSACLLPSLALIAWVIRVSDVTAIPFSPYAAQRDVRPTGLIWPWQRIADRFQRMLSQPQANTFGTWLESWHIVLIVFLLIVLIVIYWRGHLRWELLLFTVLSMFLPLMTGIFGIGRFATLTWLPLAFVYIVPAKYRWLDWLLWSVAIFLSLVVFLALNIFSQQAGYVP